MAMIKGKAQPKPQTAVLLCEYSPACTAPGLIITVSNKLSAEEQPCYCRMHALALGLKVE